MLSIIVPGIRNQLWTELYDNFNRSLSSKFEIIFCGPNAPSIEEKNVKYIRDFGNMIRCQQLALTLAEGELVHWCSDDCMPFPNMMDEALEAHSKLGEKEILMLKYTESDNPSPDMWTDEYYRLQGYPGTRTNFIPKHFFGLNMGIARREILEDLGGWDAQFKSCIGHFDLAVRAQFAGYKVVPFDEIVQHVSHCPGITGDHGPMFYAQTQEDEPLFQKLYNNENAPLRQKISVQNWRSSESVWSKRFNG